MYHRHMSRIAFLLGLVVLAGLGSGAACNGKGKSPGDAGGGASGSGGGMAGTGGGAPITSCPASDPHGQLACTGQFGCQFDAGCTCHGCCFAVYLCLDGRFIQTDFNDVCGQGPPCQDGGAGSGGSSVAGNGGAGGRGGVGSGSGGAAGTGGGGTGGASMPITTCPASRVTVGTACIGTFNCNYDDTCRCDVCCYSSYRCTNGSIAFLGNNDGCMQVTCDAGTTAAVCTFGADQTCNDNPIVSSIHGRCTDAGACVCSDAGTNPDSGRCL